MRTDHHRHAPQARPQHPITTRACRPPSDRLGVATFPNRARPAVGAGGRGFTLIEVMIVILIVLALGGIVAYNLVGAKKEADSGTVKIQMQTIQSALREFHVMNSRYPTDEEGIRVLWDKSATTDEAALKNWRKLLEEPVPADMWGNTWGYRQKSEHAGADGDDDKYDLWSIGPDKVEGTPDDVVSWNKDADTSGGGGGGGGSGTTTPSGGSSSGNSKSGG